MTVSPPRGGHPPTTLMDHYAANVEETGNDVLCPDITVTLDGNVMMPVPFKLVNQSRFVPYIPTRYREVLPHEIVAYSVENPFGTLLTWLWGKYHVGLTAEIPMTSYLTKGYEWSVKQRFGQIVHRPEPPEGKDANPSRRGELETPTDHVDGTVTPLHVSRS